MRKWLPALALLCVIGTALLFWLGRPSRPPVDQQSQSNIPETGMAKRPGLSNPPSLHHSSTPSPPLALNPSIQPSNNPPTQQFSPAPAHFDAALLASPGSPAPKLPPETVLANVRHAVLQYGSMLGGNPVGTNEEITRALNGDNPKQANFLNAEAGMRVNGQGELIDSWGTPYFFHQLSKDEMEIRSAGPDRIMWTADDLVTK